MSSEPSTAEEALAEQFYEWELRGRGWAVWDRPVAIEPPFRPFLGHWVEQESTTDDGRRPTLVSGLIGWLHRRLNGLGSPSSGESSEELVEPEPIEAHEPEAWVELRIVLPADADVGKMASERWLLSLSGCRRPLAFELIGLTDAIHLQIACDERDAEAVEHQLHAFFPEAVVSRHEEGLTEARDSAGDDGTVVAEFGLDHEFMLPLATPASIATDPLVGLIGALSAVQVGEIALVQVLFQPVSHPWAQSVLRSVVFCDGTPLFCDTTRDLVAGAKAKAARTLYAAVVRMAFGVRATSGRGNWPVVSRERWPPGATVGQ